ncbi:hypothetical protein N9W41_00360, partial [bacterium]|nr:hypothetical protein [bacterium]
MRSTINQALKLFSLLVFTLSLSSCLELDKVEEDPLAKFSKENESDVNLVFSEYINALGNVKLDSFDVGDSITYTRSFLFQGNQYMPYQTVIYKIVDISTKDSEPGFIYYTFLRKIISLTDNTPDYTVEMKPVKIATDLQTLIKTLKEKSTPTVTLHNLKISKETATAPNSSKNKGVCNHLPNDCTY